MKDFIKMMLATMAGMLLFSVVWVLMMFSFIGSLAALSSDTPTVPKEGVLYMDMSNFVIAEKEDPMDVSGLLQGNVNVKTLSLLNAVQAVRMAASDPGVKFIYMRPDGVSGGIADIEEFRRAILKFRESGKAVISFIENPSNASYYLASAADKVYVSASKGGMNTVIGLSSQMFFLKDLLDKLGVNMQLIRHGKYKSAGEMYIRNQISKENYEQTHAMVSSIWNSWVDDIAASRNITPEAFNALVDNLSLVEPEDFVSNGLADGQLCREERKQKLCDLYMTEDFDKVAFIPFEDYTAARTANPKFSTNQIAIIYADGEIVDGDDDIQNVAGDTFAELIADVRANDMVKSVVLRVNSPGGSVLASDKIRKELQLLRESKPVIASYGNYAASGGYWISAESDYIFSDATTLTGSIGVFSLIPEFGKTVKNLAHINVTNVNSNRHSDMYSAMRPLDAAETDFVQQSVEHIYDEFTSIVADGRDLRKSYVDSIAQGRVWAGADAIKIGLVDEIGGLEEALLKAAFEADGSTTLDNFYIATYPAPQSPFESLLASIQDKKSPRVFEGTPFGALERAFAPIRDAEAGKVYARLPYEYVIR
ncbi:MAG: signal peptide peptidase SppA [Candidatus Cryptobacteroides sp.]